MKRSLATLAMMFLAAACGGETLDIGGSSMGTGGGPQNDGGGAGDSVPPGPTNSTVIAPHQRGVWFLQLSGEYLYWLSSMESSGVSLMAILRRCRTDDCASTLEDVLPRAGSVQIYGGNLYFWISGTKTISSCPIGNCASPKVLASAAEMVSLFVDDSGIYWSTRLDTSIYKCPLTGCDAPERTIAGGVNAFNLTADETRLYFQNATPNFMTYNIESVPKDGSAPPTSIVGGLIKPSAFRLTGGFVYWSTWIAKGEIARCSSSGCVNGQPEILAKDQNFPINVEADEDSVFWVNENAGTAATSMTPASLHGCTIGSCPSNAALLDYAAGRATGINVNSAGFPVQNLVASKDAVYYVADLRQTRTDASIIPDCAIRRLLRPSN